MDRELTGLAPLGLPIHITELDGHSQPKPAFHAVIVEAKNAAATK